MNKVHICRAMFCSVVFLLPGCQQAGRSDAEEGEGARRPQRQRHWGTQKGDGQSEAATGAQSREGETQQHHHQIPERDDRDAGGQYVRIHSSIFFFVYIYIYSATFTKIHVCFSEAQRLFYCWVKDLRGVLWNEVNVVRFSLWELDKPWSPS